MADGLYYKVKAYLGRDFTWDEVKLVQDVNTSNHSIAEWNISSEKPKPTTSQLDALDAEATKLENNNQVVATRKSLYGTPEEQLEILVEQGVDKLIERNTKIKTDNPKE